MAAHDPAGGGARGAVPRLSRNPDAYRRGGVAGPMSPPAAVGEVREIGDGERKLDQYGIQVGAASGVGAPAPADGFEAAGGLAEAVLLSPVQRSATLAATAARNLAAYAEMGTAKTDAFGSLPVEVSGKGVVAPAGVLEGAGMADAALASCGHESSMPVRRSSTPRAMAEDHMACAQAGSGKTADLGVPVTGLAAAAAGGGSAPFPLDQITRGSRCCRLLLGLLLMLSVSIVTTEANLSVDVCPVDQMRSTCPATFQSKRPDQSLTNLIVEQRYIILPSVGKVERNEKNNNNQCPTESSQRTTLGIVGFFVNLVMNLGPLINCCRIGEVNTRRRWLLSLSSFSVSGAQSCWLIYFWLAPCWDFWKFTSSVVALIFNVAYMIFFWVMITNKNCPDIIYSLFLIIVAVASVLVLWNWELATVAGFLGFVFTASGHLFRMMASGKKWCLKASVVAVSGIVGSIMMFFKVDWSFEICYKIGSIISLVCRAIDLAVLLYYGCMLLFSQAVPGHLEQDDDTQDAETPLLSPPAPAQEAMDVPSPAAQSGTQPDGTISASAASVTVPRSSGVVVHPSSPQGTSIRRLVVQQDATGNATSPPHQEVDPARISNSNVDVATDDPQQNVPGHLEQDEDMQDAQTPFLPPPTPAQEAMDVPSPAVQSGTQPDGTISASPSVTVPRPSGVVIHPSSPQGASIRRWVVHQDGQCDQPTASGG